MRTNELARERRKQQRFERLGTNTPRCATCGIDDVRCLEAHHVAGRRSDPLTSVLCANCHRKVTDDQKDHPAPVSDADAFLEHVGHFLLGLADMLRLILDRLVTFGEALIDRARTDATQTGEVQS